MIFDYVDGLKILKFDSFIPFSLVHGIFARHGGVSPEPWRSLNVGGNNGDCRANVIENRKRIFESLGLPVESLFDVWQVHSSDVICTDRSRSLNAAQEKADAIITNHHGITLFMRFGDCVPVLLFDPVEGVVALVHAGWPGTIKKIVSKVIEAMIKRYNSKPYNIIACMGPSIGPDHYIIREDVISQVRIAFNNDCDKVLLQKEGNTHFDLWMANQLILQNAGVEKIEISRICTACNVDDWYSHREEKGKTGRFGAILAIK